MTKIPDWNAGGLLPPVNKQNTGSEKRSPYSVTCSGLIERFSMNEQRLRLLEGLLRFRKRLYALGIVEGVQWINGSFVENKEMIYGEFPNDIDVVTIFAVPQGKTADGLRGVDPELFDRKAIKKEYNVDSFFVVTDENYPLFAFLNHITHWYGVWSHTSEFRWKGFLKTYLSPKADEGCFELLERKRKELNNDASRT